METPPLTEYESGVALALLDRLRFDRLPRRMAVRARVLAGECLDSYDIRLLHETIGDARRLLPSAVRLPELASIFGGLAVLNREITTHALDNAHRRCRNAHAA
jgi:hypothetical protein